MYTFMYIYNTGRLVNIFLILHIYMPGFDNMLTGLTVLLMKVKMQS